MGRRQPNIPAAPFIDYYQTNLQGNIALNYTLNRILQLSLGYQYLGSLCDKVPSQAYNRGISYLQLGGVLKTGVLSLSFFREWR